MLVLLLSACIETNVNPEVKDPADTGAVDTAGDTGDVDTGGDDTGAPDTDTDTDTHTGDTAIDTDVDTDVDTDTDTGPSTDTGEVIDTGEEIDTDPPGEVAVDGYCSDAGYVYTSWAAESPAEPELHLTGVYESREGFGGAVYVNVERNTRMVLALTSYAAVDWHVDISPGSTVEEIVVSAYDTSTVTFVSGTSVPVTYAGWLGCGYQWPGSASSGCDTAALQANVEAYTGLAMASFQGCYAGGDFTIEG